MNQYRLIVNRTREHHSVAFFVKQRAFQNVVFKILAIWIRPQGVKKQLNDLFLLTLFMMHVPLELLNNDDGIELEKNSFQCQLFFKNL